MEEHPDDGHNNCSHEDGEDQETESVVSDDGGKGGSLGGRVKKTTTKVCNVL